MRKLFVLPMLAVLALSLPAAGQDIFQPLRDMVQDLQKPDRPAGPRRNVPKTPAPVPQERPAAEPAVADDVAEPVVKKEAAEPAVDLPRPRPEEPEPVAAPEPEPKIAPVEPAEPAVEAEPEAAPEAKPEGPTEPARIFQTACPALLQGQIEAKALPPISEGQCMAQSPLAMTGVLANGRMIPLTGAATLDCGMATALPQWVGAVDNYVQAHDNTGIDSVIVGTTYMCRNVNNEAEGNLSFHAFADAVDVVGFKLQDGRSVTVDEAWTGTEAEGRSIVRFAHDAACGRFTTVLGPEANALHHDHLHLDLGCHGKTCTARLCE